MFFKDEVARNMLAQHMRDCELGREEDRRDRDEDRRVHEAAAAEVKAELTRQNALSLSMHQQNQDQREKDAQAANARFVTIMWVIVPMLLGVIGTLSYAIFKGITPHSF